MNRNATTKGKKITARADFSSEEYEEIKQEAKNLKCPIKEYCRVKILDCQDGNTILRRKIMQLMPEFYNTVSDICDSDIRDQLTEFGETLCQYIK